MQTSKQQAIIQRCSQEKVFGEYAANLQEKSHFGMSVP